MTTKTVSVAIVLWMIAEICVAQSIEPILGYPDTIVHNAKIVTMDDASFSTSPGTIAEAMAIRGDIILAVGSDKHMRSLGRTGHSDA